jgi:hypothetical protein
MHLKTSLSIHHIMGSWNGCACVGLDMLGGLRDRTFRDGLLTMGGDLAQAEASLCEAG